MSQESISKVQMLAQIGYGDDLARADALLCQHGLTNPRKVNINLSKLDAVTKVIQDNFVLVCSRGDCQKSAKEHNDPKLLALASEPEFCIICRGSRNQSAVDHMIQACQAADIARLCVVGGSPTTRQSFQMLVADRISLRLVPGNMSRTAQQASADIRWADLVMIWGATQLGHKVSSLYTGKSVVSFAKRSIGVLADEVTRAAGNRT